MAKPAGQIEQIISQMESPSTPQDFDARFCASLAQLFDVELASILDYHETDRLLRFRYSMDLNPAEMERFFFRLGEGVGGVAAYTKRTMAVENAMESSQAAAQIARETGRTVTTLLATPAIRAGHCIAVIELLNRRKGTFTEKDKETFRLLAALYAHRRPQPRATKGSARDALPEESAILGASPAVESALQLALRAAPTDVPILLLGESGTGKELFSRRIHEASLRSDRPFVAINCAALSETLLESELFGHVRGAFTGANQNRKGRIEEANHGTVLLDEVGDMSPACQAKLLRTLDSGEVTPVGSNEVRRIDVRFIAATNRPLREMVDEGTFRADLFYRLCGLDIRLPPLRERGEDIALLADVFLRRAAERTARPARTFDKAALAMLTRHSWPGNVRELRNAIERIVLLADGEVVTPMDLPRLYGDAGRPVDDAPQKAAPDPHRQRLIQALAATAYKGTGRWNIADAARQLGIPRKTLEYQISKLGIRKSAEQ